MREAERWRVVGVSVQGASHQKVDLPCQDVCRWSVLSDDILAISVADGAGSAQFAEEAAKDVTEVALLSFWNPSSPLPAQEDAKGWELRLRAALSDALQALLRLAERRDKPLREFATTLLLVIVTPQWVMTAQIGDGAVVAQDTQGNLHTLTTPHLGEHANETTFLVSPDALDSAEIALWKSEAVSLAVFSDGLQRLALRLPEGTPHTPFFTPLFQFIDSAQDEYAARAELETFLRSPRITERADDDLTLALIHRLW